LFASINNGLIAPVVLMQEDKIDLMPDNAYLIGAIVAIIVSWRTKNLLATIVIGMAVFLIWRGIFI
jgi:branched-subunit amino acid transport protein